MVKTNRLEEIIELFRVIRKAFSSIQNLLAGYDRTDKQRKSNYKEGEVENSVSPDTSLSQLGLLHRIDWRTDLTTRVTLAMING